MTNKPLKRIRTAKITHNILPRAYEQLKELALAQGRSRTRVLETLIDEAHTQSKRS
jgi:hypothetical protein